MCRSPIRHAEDEHRQLRSLSDNPRKLAVDILNRVDEEQAFAEPLLDAVLSSGRPASDADRRLLTYLVYGTLRMRGFLDFLIDRFYKGKPDALQSGLRNILRVALFQARFAEKIPVYAAVDEAVNTTRRIFPGRENLVNAILRNTLRGLTDVTFPGLEADPAGHIAVVHSHPRWLVERWIGCFGIEQTLALCKADNEVPPLTLRVNRLKASRQEMLERLSRAGHDVRPAVYCPEGIILAKPPASLREMPEIAGGLLHVQDEASQLISRLLAPGRGERTLDLCAGTGGKTTHLAALMENEGESLPPTSRKKLKSLEATSRRMGLDVRTSSSTRRTMRPWLPWALSTGFLSMRPVRALAH